MKKLIQTTILTLALGLGIWTLAVNFAPIVANFQAGTPVSANTFNQLFNTIDANFDAAKAAIDALEAAGGLVLPFEATVNAATTAFDVTNTGTGGVGNFEIDNPTSNAIALKAIADGQVNSLAFRADNFGLGGAAFFQTLQPTNTRPTLAAAAAGSGAAGSFSTTGTGPAGSFSATNSNSPQPAISAVSNNPNTTTLLASNTAGGLAGFFSGNVSVSGTLAKGSGTFKIDHPLDPENKYLYHSFVESPDMMNIYNGNVTLDDSGSAVVAMPDYFEALNMEFRYQLTPIGAPGPDLHIAETIHDNRFAIAGGSPGMEVSWQVTGIRHDPYAVANRVQVEEDKPMAERGTYLHPEAYGLPPEMGIAAAYQAQQLATSQTGE